MAQLPSVFVTDDHEEMGDFEPVPEGWYLAEIVKSEMKKTRDKKGQYLALQFKIIDEDDKKMDGRRVFTNLNLVNANPEAVKIAQRELKSICVAVGEDGDLEDSVDLHEIPLGIKVVVDEATADWPASNTIKKYVTEEKLAEILEGEDNG